ncbi:WASH complex subunit CCDC53 [Operophtera brumata]|uniref:WASH complex subunit CCDC53 n=1 Tax=Operophtera brumata TaxID=104452 RepID=A0A0L7L900_OPEBR|nr:WASH complex subunit CCDC53 [Operophtera brumata]
MNPEPSKEELGKVGTKMLIRLKYFSVLFTVFFMFSNFQMQALQQKRTLAFVNHCVMTNVQCLNNFMQVCEDKLMQFERKLDRVDAAMVLLESKILSVPEVSALTAEVNKSPAVLEPIHEDSPETDSHAQTAPITEETAPSPDSSAKHLPEYDRFVKMVQVGVPLQAAKLKCALEGLDPNVLAEIIGK